jgi:hypothetical protein
VLSRCGCCLQIADDEIDAETRTETKLWMRTQRARHLPGSVLKADEAVRQIHLKSLNSDHSVTYR